MWLVGCSVQPYIVQNPNAFSYTGSTKIYVVSHGWHTGLVIPTKALNNTMPSLMERFGYADYIELGWGDKGFYQANEITTGLTIQAIFWPTESVIHAVAVPEQVDHYFRHSELKSLCLNNEELTSLLLFIQGSFAKDDDGQILPLRSGIYGDSQFYQAIGDYYLMNTCNKWTAKGLKSTGMDISTLFKLNSSSVMDFVREQSHRFQPNQCDD